MITRASCKPFPSRANRAHRKQGKKKITVSQEVYWRHMKKIMAEGSGAAAENFAAASKSFGKQCGLH